MQSAASPLRHVAIPSRFPPGGRASVPHLEGGRGIAIPRPGYNDQYAPRDYGSLNPPAGLRDIPRIEFEGRGQYKRGQIAFQWAASCRPSSSSCLCRQLLAASAIASRSCASRRIRAIISLITSRATSSSTSTTPASCSSQDSPAQQRQMQRLIPQWSCDPPSSARARSARRGTCRRRRPSHVRPRRPSPELPRPPCTVEQHQDAKFRHVGATKQHTPAPAP